MTHHVFRHKRFSIVPSVGIDAGECNIEKRRILLNTQESGKPAMDTAIHEALHACFWDMDDDAVTEAANAITRFLWRLGYRKEKP